MTAALRYRLAGDAREVWVPLSLSAVEQDGRWRVAAEATTGARRLPWELGVIRVARGAHSLVIGVGVGTGELRQWASVADTAVAGIRAVVPTGWTPRVTLVVPGTTADVAALSGRDRSGLEGFAGFALAEPGAAGGSGSGAYRIYLNTPLLARTSPAARLILLRHEISHVALGAPATDATPLWLEEGVAEYLGYRGSGVALPVATRDLAAAVRAGYLPRALPAAGSFSGPRAMVAYEAAHLLCQTMVDRVGLARAAAGVPADRAQRDRRQCRRLRRGVARGGRAGRRRAHHGVAGAGARGGPVSAEWVVLVVGAVALAGLVAATVPQRVLERGAPVDLDRDFSAAEQARAVAYQRRSRPLSLAATGVSLLWFLGLGLTDAGARWVARIGELGGGAPWAQLLLGVGSLLLAARLLTLPPAIASRRLQLRVGLAAGRWRAWWFDVLKSTVVSLVLALLALAALLWLVSARPQSWWWIGALGAAGLVVLLSFVLPLLVEPLFLRFRSLGPGAVRDDVLGLARTADLAVADVLVADASRRTTALNAYVSGFGPTRRVVVFDTLLRRTPDEQVRLVVAHELGHVAHRDVIVGTALGAAAAGLGVVALSLALSWSWLLARAGAGVPLDPTVVPLVLALGALAGLVGSPWQSAVSRRVEARADRYALDLAAHESAAPAVAAAYVDMQRALALTNLAPLRRNRLLYLWFATHPSTPERIALTRAWASAADRT